MCETQITNRGSMFQDLWAHVFQANTLTQNVLHSAIVKGINPLQQRSRMTTIDLTESWMPFPRNRLWGVGSCVTCVRVGSKCEVPSSSSSTRNIGGLKVVVACDDYGENYDEEEWQEVNMAAYYGKQGIEYERRRRVWIGWFKIEVVMDPSNPARKPASAPPTKNPVPKSIELDLDSESEDENVSEAIQAMRERVKNKRARTPTRTPTIYTLQIQSRYVKSESWDQCRCV
ncbi:hypothetical protein BJ742DRAFT_745878 [Cladochytrium replicatum]|nr:hypothetical protein BJ742DRAFT_745878 [Cladochytrium replicatum]